MLVPIGARGGALVCFAFFLAVSGCLGGQEDAAPRSEELSVWTLPGADPPSADLRRRLSLALETLGTDYEPRTRHRNEDGSPKFSNRLLLESSPYLRQHAHNPVNWYPWGHEAFEAARRSGRPVLLSIGYSTCHWCHVMEEESFEDVEIASYLNRHYVAIKVDREERPDIDAIYMQAVQLLVGRGGWPMTTWLTPDAEPFFGGTYFPARDGDRGTRKGFLSLLRELDRYYQEDPGRAARRAREITLRVQQGLTPVAGASLPDVACLDKAMQAYGSTFDSEEGGLQRAPKFPGTFPVRFALREWARTGRDRYREMAELTLNKMADGGIHDQVGGGFHRYSTDRRWLVPHFEKMLYDNALLSLAYVEGYRATGDQHFEVVARQTLDYALREMLNPQGGFFSATDADSLDPKGDREEGWFFTWTPRELEAALGPELVPLVQSHYGVTPGGNFEGRNILHVARSVEIVAAAMGLSPEEAEEQLARARRSLYLARASRPKPLRDEKVLTSWNGLMISALARAGFVLDDRDYLAQAARTARFVLTQLRSDGRLLRSYSDGQARFSAYLDDYAALIAGLLDLYESTGEIEWFRDALELQGRLDDQFWDSDSAGYFMTSDDHEKLLTREKPAYDGAVPSGNSLAVMNLLRFYGLTLDDRFRARASSLLRFFGKRLERYPTGLSEMLLALQFRLDDPLEIIIVTPDDRSQAEEFMDVLRRTYLPNAVISVTVEGPQLQSHSEWIPPLARKTARGGRTTAYVCRQGICRLPVTDTERFEHELVTLLEDEVAADPEKQGLP
jgi:uncharacterized protein YyaL (SSP411 family)